MNGCVIGILGGIGPEASALFYSRLIEAVQSSNILKSNEDYPNIFINSINAPELFDKNTSLDKYKIGLKELEKHNPDFIVMVCNTIHLFHEELQKEIKTPILDLRKEVENELKKSKYKKVLVLGTPLTLKEGLYNFEETCSIIPSKDEQEILSNAIFNFNKGFEKSNQISIVEKICAKYLNSGAEAVILGCTEFAVMLNNLKIPKIDTIDVLLRSTLKNLYKYNNPAQNMNKESVVNPWEVKGEVDYAKLGREFGVSPLNNLPKEFEKELLFRRKLVFAHRDFSRILEAVKNKKKFVMMTGLMPTGKFHIGHAMIARQMIFYQKLGAKLYIAVADIEAYNARGQSLEESRRIAVEEYILNYIALGLKPENCEIYFQSDRSKDAGKANAYYRLQNLLARYANFNEFKAVYGEINPGKMLSALLQASDMLHPQLEEFEGPSPVVVPVGIDQDPHLRLARDMAQRVKDFKFIQLSSTYNLFMPGLKGGKMSSSDPTTYVGLTDKPEEVKNKINKYAFSGGKDTLEEHRKHGGNPDVDVSFQYLKFMFEEDDKKLEKIYKDYKSGKLLSGELKKIVIEKINAFLKDHQAKREKAKSQVDKFILK